MKILQVITRSGLGGAQSVVVNIANELCRAGHEVIVAAGTDDGQMWDLLDSEVRREPCRHLVRPLSPVHDALAVIALRRLYRKYRPDIVHLHSSKAGMIGRMAFPRKCIVYTVHGFDSIRLAFRRLLPIERLMQRRCAAIIGVSRYDVDNLNAEGITHHVGYIYNGIPEAPATDEAGNEGEPSWNIPAKFSKTVLCVARLSPPKKHELFIETARQLPQYAFVWIGNLETVEDVPDNVFFLGNIPNAGRYNRLAHLFMLPSNYEGLPMTILEAMSYGRPVVASDVGGIREMVEDGKTGFAAENTPDAFAGHIRRILEDEAFCATLSENALQKFRESFTVDKMVGQYKVLYEYILRNP